MNLIDVVPIGKKYKKTRSQLMYEAKIMDVRNFRNEMEQLKSKYSIIFEDGYYLPSSKEEYEEFIDKLKNRKNKLDEKIKLAYKEMEACK